MTEPELEHLKPGRPRNAAGPSDGAARDAAAGASGAPRHWKAVVAMTAALVEGKWEQAATVWDAYLDLSEKAALLEAAMAIQDPDHLAEAMAEALEAMAEGQPAPPLTTFQEDAADWAALATLPEVKHYLLACFRRLPEVERVRFLRAAQKVALE